MARKRRTRVNGPYKHGNRWRIFVVGQGGEKNPPVSYPTEKEAREVAESLRRQLEGSTSISDAIGRYLRWVQARGVRPVTLLNSERFLDRFFGGKTGYPLNRLTPSRADAMYQAMLTRKHYRGTGYSAATHRAALTEAKRFGSWCVKNRLLRTNPIGAVEPVGRKNTGKEQLRGEEARKLLDYALSAYANGNQMALLPLLCLGLALRASEICGLDARDVDDGGRTLWITKSKTAKGRRRLEVADTIAACLQHQAKDRVGQLIPHCTPAMVYHHVTRMCERAGVTVVCPHGLRGTHATLAAGRGATSALLMEALGHTSIAVTQRHYIQSGTMEGAMAGEVQRQLLVTNETLAFPTVHIDVIPEPNDE
jgi:integrase